MRNRFFLFLSAAFLTLMLVPLAAPAQDTGLSPSQQQTLEQQAQKAGINIGSMSAAEKQALLQKIQTAGASAGGSGSESLGPTAQAKSAAPAPPATSAAPAPPAISASPESKAEQFFSTSLQQTMTAPSAPVAISKQPLTQFGYRFFQRSQTFTPDQSALVGPDYVLGPGDGLDIDIWGNIEGNYQVTLDRNGEITLPKVGVISLWGQTFAQAKQTIHKQIGKYFSHFDMNVTMGALRSIQVYLVGQVRNPGTYQISSVSTALTALSAAGGPEKTGSLRKVEVLRHGKLVDTIDFYDFFLHGDDSHDVRLQSGDTLFVPEAGPLVGVAGNVRRPAIYELKGGETVKDVLALAGGIVPTAFLQKVQLERVKAHQEQTILDLNLKPNGKDAASALAMKVQDRDLIKVLPIGRTGKYVALQGYVARPGDYQLNKGMRVADLLKPDNMLPEYFPGVAQVIRRLPPEYTPEILTINLQKALDGDPSQNIPLKEYDQVKVFSRQQMEQLPQVTVSGAVLKPGNYRLYHKMTVKDLVATAGNLKRSAYLPQAEIMRFTPEGEKTVTTRLVINLKKALEGDPKNNMTLQPQDHLFVRAIPDYSQRESVTITGEVLFPGTYAIAKGERLSSVLERAGGFTKHAYLRGAVFTREEVKTLQRQRLQQLINQQEQQILTLSTQMAQGAMSSADVQASQALLQSRRALLAKLEQVPVTGRMVIKLKALKSFKRSPSDIRLVNGDTLNVPDNPHSVEVLGQVYNPTALTYHPGYTVAQYLDEVGGPTGDANTGQMFVVRADGTVFSHQQGGMGLRWDSHNHRWIFGGFNTTVLYPGDTILVPEQIQTPSIMKDVKDISQIIYQMALGAAAVHSF